MCIYCPSRRIWPLCLFSSLCGSYAIILGIDQILRSGFTTAPVIYLDLNPLHANLLKYSVNGKVYGLLGGVFVLTSIGFYLQWKIIPPIMPPGHTSGNGPPAMRDDLEKIVYEMNPSIRQSMRFSKFDFKDMDHLITVNDSSAGKGDAGGSEIVNNTRYIQNEGGKNPKSDHSNSSYMNPDITNPKNSGHRRIILSRPEYVEKLLSTSIKHTTFSARTHH
ncbi:13420_t:CDS:2, partial [Cetraspora pellucida]